MTTRSVEQQWPMVWLTAVFLSPIGWLAILQLCMLGGLGAVGYLRDLGDAAQIEEVKDMMAGSVDIAARRAALAYSGVTLAITMALSITSVVWATALIRAKGAAFHGEVSESRNVVVCAALATSAILLLAVFVLTECGGMHPFPSKLGKVLLQLAQHGVTPDPEGWVGWVPTLMFLLAFIVPAVLATGAAVLVSWKKTPGTNVLLARLRELDHLLYIGALALVFGTLQLSAALSVPVASFPRTADIKVKLEMCKAFGATAPAAEQAASQGSGAGSAERPKGLEKCHELPAELNRSAITDGGRQLVRSVTLATGLAFSALLVGIYVPSLVRLRMGLESRQEDASQKQDPQQGEATNAGDIDPFRRISAFAATISPFVASLVANAFMGGWTGG